MFCSVCKVLGKYQCKRQRGLGTRPVCNWVKATSLLQKHEKLDWHLAVVEKQALSLAVMDHGTAAEQYSGRK